MKKTSWFIPAMLAFTVMFTSIAAASPADGIYATPIVAYTVVQDLPESKVPIPAENDAVMASMNCGNCHSSDSEKYNDQTAGLNVHVYADASAKPEVGWRM